MEKRLLAVSIVVLAILTVRPASAETVDLQLVLAADVSISVDDEEFRLQREGYATAIVHPLVLDAIRKGRHRAIAVCFVEWAGASAQRMVVDWTIIRDEAAARTFADDVRGAPRSFIGATAIGAAIDFAMTQFARSGVESDHRIIDISGDGDNNNGRPVELARDDAIKARVTINGLAIVNEHPARGFIGHVQPAGGIGEYYRTRVIGGDRSFVLVIDGFEGFAKAVTHKLATEIASVDGAQPIAAR